MDNLDAIHNYLLAAGFEKSTAVALINADGNVELRITGYVGADEYVTDIPLDEALRALVEGMQ